MRFDSLGMFWEDATKVKPPKKEKPVRTPPEPTWLAPDYLPHLDKAKALTIDPFDTNSLVEASAYRHPVIFDVESNPNYFLCSFKSAVNGKVAIFERSAQFGMDFQSEALEWMLRNLLIVGFNSSGYDIHVATMAAKGYNERQIQTATQMLITLRRQPWLVMREFQCKKLFDLDHIDLMGLTALKPSLKKIAGRLNSPIMQDLPFPPGCELSYEQMLITRWYNIEADLRNTILLWHDVQEDLGYRIELGQIYGIDLRSHSNPGISEAVISHEVQQRTGMSEINRVELDVNHTFRYKMPAHIQFRSKTLQAVKKAVEDTVFEMDEMGYVIPPEVFRTPIDIAGTKYQMGIGGLHSKDKKSYFESKNGKTYKDRDVRSYYPELMYNSGQYPLALGPAFRPVIRELTDTRLIAKDAGQTRKAGGLKIVVNSGFGKSGNKYSSLYGPEFLIQTTITGQLGLFMLIEMLEYVRIHVISANTDGVVIEVPDHRNDEYLAIVAEWERITNLVTEETVYSAIYFRDVNNYVALYKEPQKGKWSKGKGVWCAEDREHDPKYRICVDAGIKFMTEGIPIEKTVMECNDIKKFIYVGYSKNGCVKDGEYLGKVARWYMPIEKHGEVIEAQKGHLVQNGTGVKPCMMLPETFPDDVDKEWYIQHTYDMLKDIQFIREE